MEFIYVKMLIGHFVCVHVIQLQSTYIEKELHWLSLEHTYPTYSPTPSMFCIIYKIIILSHLVSILTLENEDICYYQRIFSWFLFVWMMLEWNYQIKIYEWIFPTSFNLLKLFCKRSMTCESCTCKAIFVCNWWPSQNDHHFSKHLWWKFGTF